MKSIQLSPTANFGDSFALCRHLFVYHSMYDKFTIHLYESDSILKELECNFDELLKTLASLDYQNYLDVFVFGYVSENHSVMIFGSSHDYVNDYRCITLY